MGVNNEGTTRVERPRSGSAPDTDPSPGDDADPIAATSAFDPPRERFESRGELGRGGMGRVDQAFDRALGRPVAIKQLLSASPTDLARFEREARITARLEHPGIVPIHDAGRSPDGTPYYVMRRVDGLPLDQLIANKSLEERLALVPNLLAACDAAGFAHARGVIHRDIKPGNILVGPFGETLLIDWGLAREIGEQDAGEASGADDTSLTRAGTIAGTPGFMAPEQARGEVVDARADVFARGATLFRVLAGRSPYGSASATQIIDDVGKGRAPDWSLVPRGVPADLRAILMKSMAVEPRDRYADAAVLSGDLRRFVTGNLVGAYRYGRLEQLRRFVRRNRGAVATAGIAVLAASAIGVVSIRRIVTERELAEQGQKAAATARDALLVAHAQELATVDPAGAITTLRQLPLDSTRWNEAWAAATTALYQGIPSGFSVDTEKVTWLDASPDSRLVVAVGFDGSVTVIDLEARTRKLVYRAPGLVVCKWTTAAWLGCRAHDAAFTFVDATTGAAHRIALTSPVATSDTDHRGHTWVRLFDDRVYALSPDMSEVGDPIVTDATQMHDVPAAERLILLRPGGVELRSPERAWWLAGPHKEISVATDGTHVALGLGDRIQIWDVRGEPRLLREIPSTDPLLLALVGDVPYLFHGESAEAADEGVVRPVTHFPLDAFGSEDGSLVVGANDGTLVIRDHLGRLDLVQPSLRALHIAQTPDLRYLIVATDQAQVLWWDLARSRPTGTTIAPGSNAVRLTKHALWTYNFFGVVRRDRATGREHELPVATGALEVMIDPLERFIVGVKPNEFTIVDARTEVEVYKSAPDVLTWAVNESGIVIAHRDGKIELLDPDGWRWIALGALPIAPQYMAATPLHAVGVLDRQACRVEVHDCAMFDKPVESMVIERSGRAWVVSGGELWRWDLGAAASRVELGVTVRNLMPVGDTTIAYGATSLVVLREPYTLVATAEIQHLSTGGRAVVFVGANDRISLFDVDRSVLVRLPGHQAEYVTTDGDIVFSVDATLAGREWKLDLPHEPAALAAWLAGVTNARRTDSGVVAFP